VGTALTRDLIQVVRAFGDVFRAVLGLSLVVEVLSGVLLDTPFPFLGVQGRVGLGGPIQGVLGSRNMLGLVALLAAVTFAIEYATRSVPRVVAATSLVAAGAMVFLSRSPVTAGVLIVAGIATVGLLGLRRVRAESRRYYQAGLLVLSLALAVVAYLGRNRLIESLNAGTEFETRYRLWHSVLNFIPLHPLEGFGWVGYWRRNLAPFFAIGSRSTGESALNAFLDVWFQTGLIGLVAFLALVLLALVRAWLTASNRRSVVHLWPALVLVVLVATAAAESALLVEYSWFTLVVCTVKAAQELSWRRALE
jgi:O-antigen ligase